jgi:ATP-binding cassette subfamily B protein
MLFLTNPVLAWFVFLPVPLLIIYGIYYSKGSRKVWKRVREAAGDLNSLLVEDIQGNRLIQTFALQKREGRRFDERAELLRFRTLRAMFRWAAYNPGTTFITNLGTVAVIGMGGWMILNGESSFGFPQLVAFLMYVNMLYTPLGQLHGINHLIAAGKASGERVFEILDARVEVESPADPEPFPNSALQINFKGVTFQYPDRPEVLQNFNLELPKGKVTALVGHTGAGKSTVANLAMRTYDVSGGFVTINGTDIRRFSLEDLHSAIGHVAQDPFLFEGTVKENMLLAKEDATEEEIEAALQGACAWEFVQKLPDVLETNIGEKGIRLSQGEKQRMTIARVLLKNPSFVILDEATASVDTITERLIQEALENLTANRTVLVIAHRLSTVRKADQIVCMQDGEIIEIGTHDELLAMEGHYAKLWSYQNDLIPENVEM